MFHAFDNPPRGFPLQRADWMAVLARTPLELLEAALGDTVAAASEAARWLLRPETGLVMVQGRVGGNGERFNLGEVTVTRCALRLGGPPRPDAAVGVAYVLGRSHRHAELAAVADALLQDPSQQAALDARLLTPARRQIALQRARRHARAQTSKVEFFTVARESGSGAGDADDAE